MADLNRVPPHDIEAEQAVLGSMLLDKDAVNEALESLTDEAFYREDNQLIFESMKNLYMRSEPIDLITVKNELQETGAFERVGGLEYLAVLPEKVPTTSNVDRYIKIVEEHYLRRKLITTSNDLIALGYDDTEETDGLIDMAEKKVLELTQRKSARGYSSIKDVLISTIADLELISGISAFSADA